MKTFCVVGSGINNTLNDCHEQVTIISTCFIFDGLNDGFPTFFLIDLKGFSKTWVRTFGKKFDEFIIVCSKSPLSCFVKSVGIFDGLLFIIISCLVSFTFQNGGESLFEIKRSITQNIFG
eukprot:Lithocolla_globosa_v1_NODE_2622_length_1930_cov_8.440000.p3 type:complete len:120 gc:universal NODE_2622_length_1930_cov_8.440000:223-582(+)